MVNRNKSGLLQRFGCVILVLAMVLCLAACGGGKKPLRAPEKDAAVPTVSMKTAYGTLDFPEQLQDNMRHMEISENGIIIEVFYMISAVGEKEVFRIYYADSQAGTHLGYLTTDAGEIPVSYALCQYADEDFADEDERNLYYSMMDAFSVVINSIHANAQFSEHKAVEPVADQEAKLRYWTLTLPENVHFTETEENGNYRVDFYGELSSERVDLYMIGLGDFEAETMLGLYDVKGVQKPVMVQTYSLDEYENWPEEDQTVLYEMMASVNTVIQTIVADKNFVMPEPGT